MPEDTLPVHVNREQLHALEVPDAFETDDSFGIAMVNHGQSVHVHLHLDDDLSEVATIEASNHFVDGESRRAVRVSVDGSGEATGALKVASAYGAETRYVTVTITESEATEQSVEVGESLSEPQPREPEPSGDDGLVAVADNPEFAVLVLGIGALVLATVVATVVDRVVVVGGALAVLVGVLVALYLVLTAE